MVSSRLLPSVFFAYLPRHVRHNFNHPYISIRATHDMLSKKLIANQGEKMEMKQKNRLQNILLACADAGQRLARCGFLQCAGRDRPAFQRGAG